MATLTVPISIDQLLELTRQLSPDERKRLVDALLAERFDGALNDSDRRRAAEPDLTDEQIQAEVDAVRKQRWEARNRAAGG
jgi:transposase